MSLPAWTGVRMLLRAHGVTTQECSAGPTSPTLHQQLKAGIMHQRSSLLSCRRDSHQDNVTHVLSSANSSAFPMLPPGMQSRQGTYALWTNPHTHPGKHVLKGRSASHAYSRENCKQALKVEGTGGHQIGHIVTAGRPGLSQPGRDGSCQQSSQTCEHSWMNALGTAQAAPRGSGMR